MRFGDIYWVPEKYAPLRGIGKHWVVLLFFNKARNIVYYQTLASGIYKIFPSFGLFADEQCQSCTKFKEYELHRLYKNVPATFLDVDSITFLNPNKYSFLRKETFLGFGNKVVKDNYFDFTQKVSSGKYQFQGVLSNFNKRSAITAMSLSSKEISNVEKNEIMDFFRLDQKTHS